MSTEKLEAIRLKTRTVLEKTIEDLSVYCSLPTISAQGKAIFETVEQVKGMMENIGGHVQILDDLGGNPVVYASFPAGEKGNSEKTLLIYNHYDVQPPEPLDEWESDPFTVTERDGYLFARGISDNKGDLVARLAAIRVLQELEGGLPCVIKFMIEGEEEIGSPHLKAYLEKYKDLFAADACIWECGGKDEEERVSMFAGVKGMAYLQLTCVGAEVDMHSAVGAYVDNAAWRLVQALATMRTIDNRITIKGFYDGIIPPTEAEKAAARNLPFDEKAVKELFGLKRPLITEAQNKDPREAMIFDPTLTICGIESGYYGPGSKTVLPKRAIAKLDCRLVPGQDPEHILRVVQQHLEKHGFTDITVESLNGQRAYRSDFSHPFIALVVDTAKDTYQTEVVLQPNSAGTGPMYVFGNHLNLPIVSTGVGWYKCRAHAPNESIRKKDFEEGIVHIAYLLDQFGKESNR